MDLNDAYKDSLFIHRKKKKERRPSISNIKEKSRRSETSFKDEEDGSFGEVLILEGLNMYIKDLKLNDPEEVLRNTPERFLSALKELTEGYNKDVANIVGDAIFAFKDEGDVEVKINDLNFSSICEHHLLPIVGTIDIKYVPKNFILGLSKFSRVVKIFAHRLQVQERLAKDICKALFELLNPKFMEVIVNAVHCCMKCRGVREASSSVICKYRIES